MTKPTEPRNFVALTDNEVRLLACLKSLHPHEKVIITADQEGRPDYFIVERTYKEFWITSEEAAA